MIGVAAFLLGVWLLLSAIKHWPTRPPDRLIKRRHWE